MILAKGDLKQCHIFFEKYFRVLVIIYTEITEICILKHVTV